MVLVADTVLMQRSQLIGKKFRPVVDLQWLPHSLTDWQLVLESRCMCNHFCARSALVRKSELYLLLQNVRCSDALPATPVTRVLALPRDEGATRDNTCQLIDQFCDQICAVGSEFRKGDSERQMWMLKAGNSSNGNGIHLIADLGSVASLLKMEHPRDSWCLQQFVSDAALVHGCRYSVRLLLLLASSQVPVQTWFPIAFFIDLPSTDARSVTLSGMGISQRHGASLPCAVCSGTK